MTPSQEILTALTRMTRMRAHPVRNPPAAHVINKTGSRRNEHTRRDEALAT